jgi:purine-binding chemotaxis protein CheW
MKAASSIQKKQIDWEEVRERLAQVRAATEEAQTLSPERGRALMEERARELARLPPEAERQTEILEVVCFALANERYAVETRYVREVKELSDYTAIPGAPPFLLGVINLRGEILAVIDLRKFFTVVERGVTDQSRVVVLGSERAEFGVLADATHEVVTLRTEEVHEPPGSVAGIGREYLRGVSKDALIVLDGAVLLADTRLFIDQSKEPGL